MSRYHTRVVSVLNDRRELSNVDLKPFLHLIEDGRIILRRHKRDGKTLGSKATSTCDLDVQR